MSPPTESRPENRPESRLENGCLIVIEGIDGAGKTTQYRRLACRLRDEGWDVVELREPTDGPFGRRIRELAVAGRDHTSPMEELELFIEDRRENVRRSILPALRRGAIVLLDRYYYSTIAYQGARGIDPAYVRARNEEFAPPADLLIYLTIPVEMAVRRIEVNREEARNLFEKESSLRQVKEIFDSMNDPQLVAVDGTAQSDAVFERIWEIVRDFLQKRTGTPE